MYSISLIRLGLVNVGCLGFYMFKATITTGTFRVFSNSYGFTILTLFETIIFIKSNNYYNINIIRITNTYYL